LHLFYNACINALITNH